MIGYLFLVVIIIKECADSIWQPCGDAAPGRLIVFPHAHTARQQQQQQQHPSLSVRFNVEAASCGAARCSRARGGTRTRRTRIAAGITVYVPVSLCIDLRWLLKYEKGRRCRWVAFRVHWRIIVFQWTMTSWNVYSVCQLTNLYSCFM